MPNFNNYIILAARVLLAVMFLRAGFPKLIDPSSITGLITGAGFPAATTIAYLTGVFEIAAGFAILVGFQTKIACSALAAFCVFTALVFHGGVINVPAFPEGTNRYLTVLNGAIYWKNLAAAGGFLALAVAGAGAYSLDARRAPVIARA